MSRLLVLTLPLLLLWWVSMDAWTEGNIRQGKQESAQEARVDGENEGREVKFVPEQKERGRMAKVDIQKLGRVSEIEIGRASVGQVDVKRARASESSRREFAEMIWSSIDPSLKEGFDEAERERLMSYIGGLISPAAKEQAWLCWAAGTPEGKVAAYHEAARLAEIAAGGYQLLANQFLSDGRWERTATDGLSFGQQGDSATVTWSIAPDGTVIPGLNDQETTGSNFRSWMASIYGGSANGPAEDQPWFEIFEDAIASMAATCGVTLVYESNDDGEEMSISNRGELGVRGDIRLSARALDGDSGNLALAFGPDHGDIIFDSSDAVFENVSGSSIRLFNTIAHEIGHSLGLAHVCPINRTKLLEPILTTTFRGAQFDEYQSLQRLYGDALERHGDVRENDTFSEATPINLSLQEVNAFSRLSIDGRRDVDFFQFEVLQGQRLEVELVPGESAYLEGEQLSDGCSQGVNFDSRAVQDLAVEVLDEDGETILAEGSAGGVGEVEQIELFEFPRDGSYFIRIRGDGANAAQLYELRLTLDERLPGARLVLGEWGVAAESGSVKNGRLDPGETVMMRAEVTNIGELATGELNTQVTGSANATLFAQSFTGVLEAGESGVLELVYGAEGECGDFAELSFLIEDEFGMLLQEEQRFELGDLMTTVVFEEDFEGLNSLPSGWSSEEAGSGVGWRTLISQASSGLRTVFAAGRGSVGEASFVSPMFVLAPDGGTLSFQHLYRLEAGFDGAVLEVSSNEGPWLDLIESPEVVVSGGYNRMIREGFGSAIGGQAAWSGEINDFVATSIEIPASWAGETLQFRWRVVHDGSSFRDGWWLDDVRMEMAEEDCELHRPEISIDLVSGSLDENFPSRPAILALRSELPLVNPVPVPLVAEGSAGGDDFQGDLAVTFPAGVTEVEVSLMVQQDEVEEGVESLRVSVPESTEGFMPGSPSFVTLEITDRVSLEGWSASFFAEPVDLRGDSDGDGLSEIAEYLLGTDPTEAASKHEITLEKSGEDWLIPLPILPDRIDAVLGVEVSGDLNTWDPVDFETASGGLLVTEGAEGGFLRLTFSLIQ